MAIDPKRSFFANQRQRGDQLIRQIIDKHSVFFYPGAGLDWEPLGHLTHLCDTFIFCDREAQEEQVTGHFRIPGLERESMVDLGKGMMTPLADRAPLPQDIRVALDK